MTVCITGMHRAGTSMVARMLNLCGLYLGPDERIMAPDEGNPAGYWQNLDLDQISEELLATFTGEWDFLLPPMPSGWEADQALDPYRTRAKELIRALAQKQPWGWKDPRCSLTLPFWKSLLPDLKVVVCLRNPVEVAGSLEKQVGSSEAFSYNLWLSYYRRIFEDTNPGERLVTHYDMYFVDPHGELARVLKWLGWQATESQITAACQTVSGSLRQHRLNTNKLDQAKVPIEVVEAYEELCSQAGEALRAALDDGQVPRLGPQNALGYRLPEAGTISAKAKQEARTAFERAHALIAQHQLAKALSSLQEAVAKNPFHAPTHNDLGVLYLTAGEQEQALVHLGLAHRLEPGNMDTAKNLAALYLEVGRIEDAIQTTLDIVERKPDDVEALHWLATACASQGMKEQAGKLYAKVLELAPDHPGAKKGLALIRESGSNG